MPNQTVAGQRGCSTLTQSAPTPEPTPHPNQVAVPAAAAPTVPGDLALVLHTSGTTKKPKIVPLTHSNLAHGIQCAALTYLLTYLLTHRATSHTASSAPPLECYTP